MKRIGFIDYYISEWHANNYPAWIMDANKKLGFEYEVAFAWAEQDISPVDGVSTDEWCKKMGVTRCQTIAELCEKSDVILILAPSNPEKHLQYAREALPFGKRTYIDKTFAPDFETAEEIFKIAQENGTPFFSTSALRYAEELKELTGAKNLMFAGGGSNFEEYIIHTVEMAVVLLQDPAQQVKVESIGRQRICRMITENGAQAAILFAPPIGFSVTAENEKGESVHKEITSEFFLSLIVHILRFFEDGRLPFDAKQTLEVMRLRSGLLNAEKSDGQWIALDASESKGN